MTNFFLTSKECILESPTSFYGCFYLGPFNSSQSLTVANALRRTLLSEIPGLGIESIEIEGVEHEFCTFPGIRESILDLLLNFKEIVLKYNNNEQKKIFSEFSPNKEYTYQIPKSDRNSNKKPLYGYLQVRGPGIIRASDLKLPASVISVDPNQYIATLTTDGFLNIRFTICEGFTKMQNSKVKYNQINKNLVEKEFSWLFDSETFKKNESLSNKNLEKNFLSNKKIFKNTKTLWLDPVFTPILKVNYMIESYGSLELNPSNQVILLELWTNGSIHPRDALYSALNELHLIFSKLEQMKILNSIFAKSILKDNTFYSKIIKKVKYDYSFYKSNNLKKLKKNLFEISGNSQSGFLGSLNHQSSLHQLRRSDNKPNSLIHLYTYRTQLHKDVKDTNELSIIAKKNGTIDSLDLPFRIKNSLKNANIISIQNLLNYKIEDLKKIPGIGNQSLILLIKKLNANGLKLKR
uniref:DNA-directed RNA polymerase n=1 Tax=Pseudopediastrum sp. CL0201VA TaxID=2184484 RepID=A0A2U8GJS6_9CHLO|nr:alpha subunit of RNA polymerase [Pseudopediastrum sp. CL0201VA]AWI68873.1 alpha subunit of RNA polymerase [Pseudopediastrum sp. CL0201VA]